MEYPLRFNEEAMVKLGKQTLTKWQLPLTLVLFLSGLLLILALRSMASSGTLPSRTQNENLANLIKSQESQIAGIELNVSGRRNLLNTFQLNSAAGRQTLADLQNQIKQQDALAGFTDVQGPGLVISLDDNRKDAEAAENLNPAQYNPDDYLIHDQHLLYIVNDLRSAGAEAISVNDQRVVATTEIRCAGTTILVNSTRLAPPYIIRAIGNPDDLTSVLESPENEYNILKMAGFPVSEESSPAVLVPAYKGSYQFSYATPK
jgi:uncharacterized protein YlxW (UPF0749 family)